MDPLELITNEAAIASNMSKHNHFLKLLGCCLETELPTLVYEFPEKGNLSHHIYGNGQSLSWHIKLKIAIQVADAIAYLHYGTSKKIFHRRIKTGCIFLDHDFVAKLSEFQTSVLISSGETDVVADVSGTPWCFAPELRFCGRYTKKTDVYNFGIVLCDILTGKKAAGSETLHASVNSYELDNILQQNLQGRYMGQMTECTKLALWCREEDPCDRPTMKDATKRLRLIRKSS